MSTAPKNGGELFIVDNSDEAWKGLKYLQDWTEIASAFDIATGYFEIGSLLSLDGKWQNLDKIRILMGNEVSSRTRQAILEGLKKDIKSRLDASIESEKEKNDFLTGVASIVQALRDGKIQCRAYSKKKFHAKAYITHPRVAVIGSVALVGSSNFTVPGLTQNIELNIQVKAAGDVRQLQDWYEHHWQEAEDITPEILATVERHIRDYTPFDIYAKALDELFRRHELTASEWETTKSRICPILDQYQRDGYASLYHIASNYGGAFLCDGVGLEDGLASTVTWGEIAAKNATLKIPEGVRPEEMFVQILDPATGTATFLVEVIEVIHRTLKAKWDQGGLKAMPKLPPSSFPRQPSAFGEYWNQYVPLALLPRVHGYRRQFFGQPIEINGQKV